MVRYSVLHGNDKLFASKYRLILPSEEELRAELERERRRMLTVVPAEHEAKVESASVARLRCSGNGRKNK